MALHYSRITGHQPEVMIGMPVHNHKNAAEKRTVGMFSSMLPLAVAVDAHASFEDTVRALVAQSKLCYRHQRFPLYEIVRHSQSRLFDLTVSVEQFAGDLQIEGGRIFMVALHNGFEDVPLALRPIATPCSRRSISFSRSRPAGASASRGTDRPEASS